MSITERKNLLIAIGLVLFAVATRLIPHLPTLDPIIGKNIPNFSPIMALALFGGAFFNDKRLAYAVPLTALFLSDALLGFYPTIWAVYLAFAIGVSIGFLLRKRASAGRIIAFSLTSSVIFFLITNFAHWLMFAPYYATETFIQCYIDAIPFFRNAVLGDLVYSAVIFGAYAYATKYMMSKQTINNK